MPENCQGDTAGVGVLAYDPDDPTDPYNDPNDPNRHRPGDTWEIGGKPYDPYDPGPWRPGRVRRPDRRTGRHRRGELPDPLPDGPQYDIRTGLAYPITERMPDHNPPEPQRRRRLTDDRPSPRPTADRTLGDSWGGRYATTHPAPEPMPPIPEYAPAPIPVDPDLYENTGLDTPPSPSRQSCPQVVESTPSLLVDSYAVEPGSFSPAAAATAASADPVSFVAQPEIASDADAPDRLPGLAEAAWHRFLTHSADLHSAHYETLSSIRESRRATRRLAWMLRWMLTVLALGLVPPPEQPERRSTARPEHTDTATRPDADASHMFRQVRTATGGTW